MPKIQLKKITGCTRKLFKCDTEPGELQWTETNPGGTGELARRVFKIVVINILMGLNKKIMCRKLKIYFSTGKYKQ